jgi:cytochrome c
MRKSFKALAVAGAAVAAVLFCAGTNLLAGGDDDAAEDAAAAKVAKDALDKAVDQGNKLFHSKELGKKSCASCHENPEKPNLNLTTRSFSYPAYSKKKRSIVSMGQKINEMLTARSGAAKEMDLAGADVVSIEAYVMSLRKK